MKDEEMEEQFANGLLIAKGKDPVYRLGRYEGFLAGLKAGRPQWHDLRKDPNDLPKEGKQYLCLIKSWVGGEKVYACLIYNTQYHSWQESYGDVIAWCEIPTFDKE